MGICMKIHCLSLSRCIPLYCTDFPSKVHQLKLYLVRKVEFKVDQGCLTCSLITIFAKPAFATCTVVVVVFFGDTLGSVCTGIFAGWSLSANIDLNVAVYSSISRRTFAFVRVFAVDTGSTIFTWITAAFVDIFKK